MHVKYNVYTDVKVGALPMPSAFTLLHFCQGASIISPKVKDLNISEYIVACHLPRAPSYGGVRSWVKPEGSQMCGDRALAGASNLLG